ncbi:MAG: LuxR C-terminal-related transcriptional regulator [Saprospiraceae bacterium]
MTTAVQFRTTIGAPIPLARTLSFRKGKSKDTVSDECIWQQFLSTHRIIHLLRPDYFMIYKFSKATTLFERNISLDLGNGEVTAEKIMHSLVAPDLLNIKAVDKAMYHMTTERKLQPFDYVFRVCGNVECPNTSLKRIMRTSFIIHSNHTGTPELIFYCFHDVSSMVSSIRPNNYDVTFDPLQAHLGVELGSRLKSIRPDASTITGREKEIVRCLHNGMSSKEIAGHLFISKSTVDTHRQNMLRKWELPNTAALLKKAVEEDWI